VLVLVSGPRLQVRRQHCADLAAPRRTSLAAGLPSSGAGGALCLGRGDAPPDCRAADRRSRRASGASPASASVPGRPRDRPLGTPCSRRRQQRCFVSALLTLYIAIQPEQPALVAQRWSHGDELSVACLLPSDLGEERGRSITEAA